MAGNRSFQYGKVAVEVVRNYRADLALSEQWDTQLKKLSVPEKGCPKNAFLGLCSEGMVKGISKHDYVKKNNKNKKHAIGLYEIYKNNRSLPQKIIYEIYSKQSAYKNRKGIEAVLSNNNQFDVVICLLEAGLLIEKD